VKRAFEQGVKVERWQYGKTREVVLKEDVVDSWAGFPAQAEPASAPPAPPTPPTPPAEPAPGSPAPASPATPPSATP
jgi:hypothetical protein